MIFFGAAEGHRNGDANDKDSFKAQECNCQGKDVLLIVETVFALFSVCKDELHTEILGGVVEKYLGSAC